MTHPADNIDESIEKSFRRGEWATQAMTTMRHVRAWKQVVTFSVVHIPSNTRVIELRALASRVWCLEDAARREKEARREAERDAQVRGKGRAA